MNEMTALNTKIVLDSSADITAAKALPRELVPLKIRTSQKEYVDNAALDVGAMIADLRAYSGRSSTSCPNPQEFIRRGVSRRTDIIYENSDGTYAYDDIEDPLPFDVNAPVVTVEDRDYAFFYRDLGDSLADWDGRTVKFKGLIARNKELGDRAIVIGRHVMTCCEDDIAFSGLVCNFERPVPFQTGDWAVVTARIKIERHRLYGSVGPVLYATDVAATTEPKNTVVTFY